MNQLQRDAEKLDRVMNVREWDWTADELADALEAATVHLFCAPEDLQRVRAWVALQPSADLYRVRSNPFVPPRTAYAFQLDGVLAPPSLSCVMRA